MNPSRICPRAMRKVPPRTAHRARYHGPLAAAIGREIDLARIKRKPLHRAEAMERARQLAPLLAELKSAGMSARRMAAELTARGVPTPNGAKWYGQTVRRMIDRVGC